MCICFSLSGFRQLTLASKLAAVHDHVAEDITKEFMRFIPSRHQKQNFAKVFKKYVDKAVLKILFKITTAATLYIKFKNIHKHIDIDKFNLKIIANKKK